MDLWDGKWRCKARPSNTLKIISWCYEQFGPSFVIDGRWYYNAGYFYFKNEADAMWFELRW